MRVSIYHFIILIPSYGSWAGWRCVSWMIQWANSQEVR